MISTSITEKQDIINPDKGAAMAVQVSVSPLYILLSVYKTIYGKSSQTTNRSQFSDQDNSWDSLANSGWSLIL